METAQFLQTHPVFTLEEAETALRPRGGRNAVRERLKYHLECGRLKSVVRGVYAAVPPGLAPERFQPDPFLVAYALRADAVFSHHCALDLLGAAHSDWNLFTVLTTRRRRPLDLDGFQLRFLNHPVALERAGKQQLGLRTTERSGKTLRLTGPERTLIDGFRQPHLAGGVEELVESAAGFPVLELELLQELLSAYGSKSLWAATGWFLERYRQTFYVSDEVLAAIEVNAPTAPHYFSRNRRGGTLAGRWNLIVPESFTTGKEPDEA